MGGGLGSDSPPLCGGALSHARRSALRKAVYVNTVSPFSGQALGLQQPLLGYMEVLGSDLEEHGLGVEVEQETSTEIPPKFNP